MGTLTMKFGGASVGTTTGLTQVVSIILQAHEHWDQLVIVVSAMEGVTDALLEASHLAQLSNRRGYRRIVGTIRTRHLALIDDLPFDSEERNALQAEIDRLLFDMLDICQTMSDANAEITAADKVDAVISVGEKLSSRIVAALLRHNGLRGVAIDATDIIITDDVYGNANPNLQYTAKRIETHLLPMLKRKIIPVVTGFIAGTPSGQPTTLGRGGSDYTASILSICIDADQVWMWTSVDGMMSSDPREMEGVQIIPEISYDEVAELAYFGARILHARMIGPLKEKNIPLHIKNVFKPQQPGTIVHAMATAPAPPIKAVTSIHGIGLTAETSGPLAKITELVNNLLEDTVGSAADVMITSQSLARSFLCFIIPTSAGPDAIHTILVHLDEELRKNEAAFSSWRAKPVSVLTAIGTDLDRSPEVMGDVLRALDGIPILALAQGPSRCSLSIVLDPTYASETLNRIHALIVEPR